MSCVIFVLQINFLYFLQDLLEVMKRQSLQTIRITQKKKVKNSDCSVDPDTFHSDPLPQGSSTFCKICI